MEGIRPVLRSKAEARRAYDRMSAVYDWLTAGEAYMRRRLLRLAAPALGERVLDLGAGTGSALSPLSKGTGAGGFVVGLDLSPGMLRRAQEKTGAAPEIGLVRGDSAHLPFASGSFDLVVISFALELFEVDEIPGVLAGCRRALRPQGRLVIGSLAARPRRSPIVRLYEWLHDRFPAWIDCRPIPLREFLAGAGFHFDRAVEGWLWGLPVDLVVGWPS